MMDALWDGSRAPSYRDYFRVVRRVREALAARGALAFNPLPYEGGLDLLSPHLDLHIDAAPVLYRGPFPHGLHGEWVEEVRRQLEADAVAAALSLGAALEVTDPHAAAGAFPACAGYRAVERCSPRHPRRPVRIARRPAPGRHHPPRVRPRPGRTGGNGGPHA